MGAKILITGVSNSGKTTLLKSLDEALIIAIDGKKYPFKQFHKNMDDFRNITELCNDIDNCVNTYIAKTGKIPKTIAIDSASRIATIIVDNCQKNYTGFDVWKNIDIQIKKFADYIESLAKDENDINVIIIAHAIFDNDSGKYVEVSKGTFFKIGGFLSLVDYALFIEATNHQRIIHHRNPFFLSRTLLSQEEIPDKEDATTFNLQEYLNKVRGHIIDVEEFQLK
jgi:cytidylate kinase